MVHIKKGELTQEEKSLLEVIGKGMGAGLSGGAASLPGGVAEPGRRPTLLTPGCGLRGPGNSVSAWGVGPTAGAERWGGTSAAGSVAEGAGVRALNQLLERCTIPGSS